MVYFSINLTYGSLVFLSTLDSLFDWNCYITFQILLYAIEQHWLKLILVYFSIIFNVALFFYLHPGLDYISINLMHSSRVVISPLVIWMNLLCYALHFILSKRAELG